MDFISLSQAAMININKEFLKTVLNKVTTEQEPQSSASIVGQMLPSVLYMFILYICLELQDG